MLSENIETNIIKYKMFEFNKNKTLKVLITYIKDNEIIEIKKSKVNLKKKNILSKEELADLLINNKTLNNTTYNAYRIMNFNLSLEPEKLENFLGNELFGEDDEKDSDCGSTSESDGEGEGDGDRDYGHDDGDKSYKQFTNDYRNLADINVNDTISMFGNLNMLMIILKKRLPSKNQTRRKGKSNSKSNSKIKHVSCNIKGRKTRKFLY